MNDIRQCVSSGLKTETTQITTNEAWVVGFCIKTDGSNDATLTVYNGTSADNDQAVTPAFKVTSTDNYGGMTLPKPVWCQNGIYAVLSGTNAQFTLYYHSRSKRGAAIY